MSNNTTPASSPSSNTTPASSPSSNTIVVNTSSTTIVVVIVVVSAVVIVVAILACVLWKKWKIKERRAAAAANSSLQPPPAPNDYLAARPPTGSSGGSSLGEVHLISSSQFGPRNFTYQQLSIATKNFNESELLGRGGFGAVYRGTLPEDGSQLVAVKCISENSSQGVKEFKAEVTIISDLRHRNLVKLRGWCHDSGRFLLVYDYMPNGSLDYLLFNNSECYKLSWSRRCSIASGLGSALQYLHDECDNVIIHRDVKSSNVLLDDNFNAKLGDFGLSRQVDQGVTAAHTTIVAGTRGYMAPECFGTGKATRESDVYAFGAVLLELVCGKSALDPSLRDHDDLLLEWVWDLFGQGKLLEAVDKRLNGSFDAEEATRLMLVGLSCSHPDPKARPKIKRALEALDGTIPLPYVPASKPIPSYGPPPPMSISQVLGNAYTGSTTSNSAASSTPFSASSSDHI